MSKRSASSARDARAGVSARRTARKIDFSDIPEASASQLGAMRRVGRPPLGENRPPADRDPARRQGVGAVSRGSAAPRCGLPDADQRGARRARPQ